MFKVTRYFVRCGREERPFPDRQAALAAARSLARRGRPAEAFSVVVERGSDLIDDPRLIAAYAAGDGVAPEEIAEEKSADIIRLFSSQRP